MSLHSYLVLAHRGILSGLWLWAVSNFVTFCPDWPPAVGPKIHIFCLDRDQGFPAIARGPHSPHKHSAPSSRSTQSHERHAPFSPSVTPSEILHIFNLTSKDNDVHLRASTNGRQRADRVNLVIWEVLGKFSIAGLSEKYKTYLAMVLGIWHFAAKSHVNVKRVYSRFGNIVSDTTARKALDYMTGSSLATVQASVKAATERGETEWCIRVLIVSGP
ncbi:uncharacterized protein LACBIDRAFT_322958 [Laccaria bicolor S238N-H82]|uniref:Predicted protein n=1 Tax=Laccaria bicolor (strain S238N-H82 / ATCC MYA-4686) TaxID=486041 RepID=B0CVP6_LACBS|nr:uncharacterized protein LACBIDRAFT_322958 [Laccaria bicolor S238N-H82]EDR13784.1 predicted protein [Laccaria bicolor S238N-H82]|eukprot:XP_001876282.1 predicted protein [Laccaria bicolor S238N-H82]